MKITNKCGNNLLHNKIYLAQGATGDIPNEIAQVWLKIKGVEKYVAPVDVEQAAKKAKEEAEKKFKAELEKAKKEASEEAKKEAETEIAKLKAELEKAKKEAKQ